MSSIPIIASRYDHVNRFINELSPIVCNEWLRRKATNQKTISPATVLAQAALESGWDLNSKSLFGIKGEGTVYDTQEYIDGSYIDVKDEFLAYGSIAEAVIQYYDLMQWDNYDDATSADTVEGEIEGLTNDIGYAYATSPTYGTNVLSIVNDYDLRVFNDYVRNFDYSEDIKPTPEESEDIKPTPEESHDIEAGDSVRVITDSDGNVYDFNGTLCHCWHDSYIVVDINSQGACLAVDTTIFARIPLSSIIRI